MSQLINYQTFLQDMLLKIQSARYEMLKSISKQTVKLYREIGKSVSEKIQEEGRGSAIVEQLSKDLQTEFPWIRGFSSFSLIWNHFQRDNDIAQWRN